MATTHRYTQYGAHRTWRHSDESITRKLAYYYDHTREWWGQAIWFYNNLTGSKIPLDLFEAAEGIGLRGELPHGNTQAAEMILGYWRENHRMAELVLPER